MTATLAVRAFLCATAMLAVLKAGSLVMNFPAALTGGPAHAEGRPAPPAPEPATPPARQEAAAQPAPARAAQAPAAQPAQAEPIPGETETALAVQLRARREALEARERLLMTREAVLAATEQRLSSRVDELASLQTRLERSETAAVEREENHWRGLAKLYETMRPREAAAVFNDLDLPILVQIVDRMNDRRAAPVLGAMQPDRVRQLTAELARHRAQRPQSPSQQEGTRQ